MVARCQQLYGGYGYLRNNPAPRDLLDSRQANLYGVTTEIMKEIIGRAVTGSTWRRQASDH